MSLLIWTLGKLLGVTFLIALVIGMRVLIDAIHLFHTSGMRRVRSHR